MNRASLFCIICLLFTFTIGCSGRYPVTGTVKYADGTPCPGGTVIAEGTVEGKLVGLQGNIEKDGTFSLGSQTPGEGALPGKYKVMIVPIALSDFELGEGKKPDITSKFGRFETSGIEFDVKNEPNKFDVIVDKPK